MRNICITLIFFIYSSSAFADDLFGQFEEYIDFLNKRDKVLSQNIANADTPRYAPQELDRMRAEDPYVALDKTNAAHMDLGEVQSGYEIRPGKVLEEKRNGNKVTLEHELFKKAENAMKMQEVLNVYNKSRGMYKTAISGGGGR